MIGMGLLLNRRHLGVALAFSLLAVGLTQLASAGPPPTRVVRKSSLNRFQGPECANMGFGNHYQDMATAVRELHDDHATVKASADAVETLAEELKADFNLLRANLFNACFQKAGLAEGTNANTLKTTVATYYSIDGVLYTKAITDNIAMTAAAQQAISTYCLYLVSIDSSGTVTVTKGTELATDTAVLPARPASEAVIGAFKIATDGATTFTSGTTDLGAAGITDTHYDLMFANSGADAATAIAASDPASGPATLTASKPAVVAD